MVYTEELQASPSRKINDEHDAYNSRDERMTDTFYEKQEIGI